MQISQTQPRFNLRAYDVLVTGFEGQPCRVYAMGPGAARAAAHRQFLSAYPQTSFKDFMKRSTIKRVEDGLPETFGKSILVGGTPAYQVDRSAQYIRFIRPGSNQIMLSHPLDVTHLNSDKEAA